MVKSVSKVPELTMFPHIITVLHTQLFLCAQFSMYHEKVVPNNDIYL